MEESQWIIDLESELNAINPSKESQIRRSRCIYRVPNLLRDLHSHAFTPRLVSLGPFHHHDRRLNPMEPHKRRALFNFLRRSRKKLGEVVAAMRPAARELMESYDGLEEEWRRDEDRFLGMMILDGCFFLDLMVWDTVEFLRPYMGTAMLIDLLMLENQLPLSLLSILLEIGGHKSEDIPKFFSHYAYLQELEIPDPQQENLGVLGLHHLDLVRRSYLRSGEYCYDPLYNIPSATELLRAGVSFKPMPSGKNIFTNISFSDGVLTLPFWRATDDITAPMFLNLLAFEQIHGIGCGVTSYVFCMDNLISTAKDVALLKEKGILQGYARGSDDDTAHLFNHLTKGLAFPSVTGSVNVNKQLTLYMSRRWPTWRASFIHTYLSTPWVFISLVGAFVLLVLTIAQTMYSVLSYYQYSP